MNRLYNLLEKPLTLVTRTSKILAVSICALTLPLAADAQVMVNQNFDTGITLPNLPNGWLQNKISGSGNGNEFTTVTTGTLPTCSPFSPSVMIKYDAATAGNGDQAFMVTSPFDFAARGGSNPTVSFRIFRDNTRSGDELLQVYSNNAPNLGGAVLLGSVRRNRNLSTAHTLTEASDGWYNYTYLDTSVSHNSALTYLLFVCTTSSSGTKGNIFIDNLAVNTYPIPMTIASANTTQNTAPVGLGTTNQDVIRLEVNVQGAGVPLISMSSITINAGGTSLLTDITNARIWYTGLSNIFATTTQFGPTQGVITGNFVVSGSQVLQNGTNYFWLTYDITSNSSSVGNVVDADWDTYSTSVGGPFSPLTQAPSGARPIAANYCQPTYSSGTSWPGDYIAYVGLPGLNGIIDNATGYAPHPPDYTYYAPGPNTTTTLTQGIQYPFTARVGNYCCQNNIIAWIDFNRNGTFENFERIYEMWYNNGNLYAGGNTQRTANFIVPNLGNNPLYWGQTRLRVREIYNNRGASAPNTSGATTPTGLDPMSCNNYGWGETEDYIVTIQPDCTPGTWLGFTNDWNTASNWCGGIPTNTVDVLIPKAPIGGVMPTIFTGTNAVTRDLTIDTLATLTTKAANSASLTVNGNLLVRMPDSKLDVTTNFSKYAAIGSGKNFGNTSGFIPLRGARPGHKIQMLYFANELTARGFKPGDQISSIGWQIIGSANGANDTIKNITTTISNVTHTNVGPFTPIGNWLATGAGAQNNVTAAFKGACPGGTCIIQPAGYSGIAVDNMFTLAAPFVWTGGNIMVEVCYNSGAIKTSYIPFTTQTTGVTSVIYSSSNVNGVDGCTGINPPSSGTGGFGVTDYRANLVISASETVVNFPVTITGNFVNNGTTNAGNADIRLIGNFTNNNTFNAGASELKFVGSTLQNISGTSPTTFNRVYINNTGTNQYIRMNQNITTDIINRTGTANRGILDLNGYRLTVTNPGNPALRQDTLVGATSGLNNMTPNTVGWIMAETRAPQNMGWVQWNLGWLNVGAATAAPARTFPFISSGNINLSVDFSNPLFSAMDVGNVSVTTYPTPASNLPLPPGVLHISQFGTGIDNFASTVDRFWIVERTGPQVNGGIRLRWLPAEDFTTAAVTTTNAKVQQFKNPNVSGNPGWMVPMSTTLSVVTPRLATVATNTAWNAAGQTVFAVANNATPLPVELLNFDAKLVDKKVELNWSTASEKENSHFTIERTRDGENYQYVTKVNGAGNSSSLKDYYTVDPAPLRGISYYRLSQTDLDGASTQSDLVAISNTGVEFDIAFLTSAEGILQIGFTYDSNEPLKMSIVDALGRQVFNKNFNEVEPGYNTIHADTGNLSPGVYFISLHNSNRSVSRKLMY